MVLDQLEALCTNTRSGPRTSKITCVKDAKQEQYGTIQRGQQLGGLR